MQTKLTKTILSGKQLSVAALASQFETTRKDIREIVAGFQQQGYNIYIKGDLIQAVVAPKPRKRLTINADEFTNADGWFSFGACGDKHMGSKHCRLDVLNALYDVYEREGIKVVFDTGNYIDGEARFNFHELDVYGMQSQVENWAKNHPKRDGIITYFIAGDDHEGWYAQKLKMDIGAYSESIARQMGRDDLRFIGYMKGEVEIRNSRGGKAIIQVQHPGGGSAYAESYTQQKIAEAFPEGEKPHVCLIGHYHKAIYGVHRGIHMLQTGCTQDQSSFMFKKRLKAAVGGWIVRLHQGPRGDINRFSPEFFHFYGRSFYKNRRNFNVGLDKGVIRVEGLQG